MARLAVPVLHRDRFPVDPVTAGAQILDPGREPRHAQIGECLQRCDTPERSHVSEYPFAMRHSGQSHASFVILFCLGTGADEGIRTLNLMLTKHLLCR